MLTAREERDRDLFLRMALGTGWRAAAEEETVCLTEGWHAFPWHGSEAVEDSGRWTRATHYAVSTLRTPPYFEAVAGGEDPDRAYRRVEARVGTVLGFLADDVGTKARASDLLPTARVETRPGNEQHWYRFEGVVDPVAWRVLAQAWKAAGLTDEDGQNPVRLGRLPGSQPPEKGRAKLVQITGLRWPWAALMQAAGVGAEAAAQRVQEAHLAAAGGEAGISGTMADLIAADRGFAALAARGMVLRLSGVGPWWRVVCPWGHEHSDGDEKAGARYLPTGGACGGFVCNRSGTHARSEDFKVWLAQQRGLDGNGALADVRW